MVELERLRPPGSRKPANFTRRVFRIPPGQEANVKITEHHLPKLAKLAQLCALNTSPDGKSLVGTGVQSSLETAQGLLDMHFKKVHQLAHMEMQKEQLKKRIEQTEEHKTFDCSVRFVVQVQEDQEEFDSAEEEKGQEEGSDEEPLGEGDDVHSMSDESSEEESEDEESFGSDEEDVVGYHCEPLVGHRVILRDKVHKSFHNPDNTTGTITRVNQTDADGDGITGEISEMTWDLKVKWDNGQKANYRTGFQGTYRLQLDPNEWGINERVDIGAEADEEVVGLDVVPLEGQRVVLMKQALRDNPSLWEDSKGGPGTISWVDPEDADGDGSICEVTWDLTNVRADYRTGFEDEFRLALHNPAKRPESGEVEQQLYQHYSHTYQFYQQETMKYQHYQQQMQHLQQMVAQQSMQMQGFYQGQQPPQQMVSLVSPQSMPPWQQQQMVFPQSMPPWQQ